MGKRPDRPLTKMQWKFCLEYVKDFDAAAAARRAGYHEISIRMGDVNNWPSLPKFANAISELMLQQEDNGCRPSSYTRKEAREKPAAESKVNDWLTG